MLIMHPFFPTLIGHIRLSISQSTHTHTQYDYNNNNNHDVVVVVVVVYESACWHAKATFMLPDWHTKPSPKWGGRERRSLSFSLIPPSSRLPLSTPIWQSHPVCCQCNKEHRGASSWVEAWGEDPLQFINNFQSCLEKMPMQWSKLSWRLQHNLIPLHLGFTS